MAPLWLSFDIGDGGPCSAGWTDPAEPAESAGMGGRRSKGGAVIKLENLVLLFSAPNLPAPSLCGTWSQQGTMPPREDMH